MTESALYTIYDPESGEFWPALPAGRELYIPKTGSLLWSDSPQVYGNWQFLRSFLGEFRSSRTLFYFEGNGETTRLLSQILSAPSQARYGYYSEFATTDNILDILVSAISRIINWEYCLLGMSDMEIPDIQLSLGQGKGMHGDQFYQNLSQLGALLSINYDRKQVELIVNGHDGFGRLSKLAKELVDG